MSSRIRHQTQSGKVTFPPGSGRMLPEVEAEGWGLTSLYKRSQIWWVGRRHPFQIHLTFTVETKIIQYCSHQC